MNLRRLLLPLAAAVALAPAGSAQAASFYPYKISIKGEQTHAWTYTGTAANACGTPESGSGRQHFVFRGAPYKTIASRAGGTGHWGVNASWKLKAQGTRQATHTVFHSQSTNRMCQDEDFVHATSDCGDASWTIDAAMQYGLQKPYGRMHVQSAGGGLGGGGPFENCPWFEGPDNSTYWDQLGRETGTHSNDMQLGLRYAWQDVKPTAFQRGKSFTVSRRLVKPYEYKDQWGALDGHVEIRWTIHFQRTRR